MKALKVESINTRGEKKFKKVNFENLDSPEENLEMNIDLKEQQEEENYMNYHNTDKRKSDNTVSNLSLTLKLKSNPKSRWSKEEEIKLLNFTKKKPVNWDLIAAHFPNKTRDKCYTKYSKLITDFKKGKWTEEEDKLLYELTKKFSLNWKSIAGKFKRRSLTQIKQRYFNCLDPAINRAKFTEEEDSLLLEKYEIYGANWKKIAEFFTNRPSNLIKNRYYTKIRNNATYKEEKTKNSRIRKSSSCNLSRESESLQENKYDLSSLKGYKKSQALSFQIDSSTSKIIETELKHNSITQSGCLGDHKDYRICPDKAYEDFLLSKKRKRVSEIYEDPKIPEIKERECNKDEKDIFNKIICNPIAAPNVTSKAVNNSRNLVPISKSFTVEAKRNPNVKTKVRRSCKKLRPKIKIINYINNITINDFNFKMNDNQESFDLSKLNKDITKNEIKQCSNNIEFSDDDLLLHKTNKESNRNNYNKNNYLNGSNKFNDKLTQNLIQNRNQFTLTNKNPVPNHNADLNQNSKTAQNQNNNSIIHNNLNFDLNELSDFLQNSNKYFNSVIDILKDGKLTPTDCKQQNLAHCIINTVNQLESYFGKWE